MRFAQRFKDEEMQYRRRVQGRAQRPEPKTFVVGHDDSRPLLFTPQEYDASTGLLHGINQSECPMSLPLTRLLPPYEPVGLDWDDETVQQLESKTTDTVGRVGANRFRSQNEQASARSTK